MFIFRRDLRLQDNTALNQALEKSAHVVPLFNFDPIQVGEQNSFRSDNAIQFMIESLDDLAQHFKRKGAKLYFFNDEIVMLLERLIQQENVDAVFTNRDYTPFSIKRDEAIRRLSEHHGVAFEQYDDALLNSPEKIHTQSNTPFSVYTAFYKNSLNFPVTKPVPLSDEGRFYTAHIPHEKELLSIKGRILKHENPHINIHGGRQNAIAILKDLSSFTNYQTTRDFPSIPTTHLSGHNKFGTVSIREVYHMMVRELGYAHGLIRQLYWRDFFTHVAYHSPFVFGQAFHKKYEDIPWINNEKLFKAWCDGLTGFPIVDAGMRQLRETGFMHNRTRMIVGSFLVKDLHIDWQWGEKFFAQHLLDYDPAVNNGSWQWVASTGCDATPYFRIFNPWLQQEKFDKSCTYIKKWVPELKQVSPDVLHDLYKDTARPIKGYPRPMVNHSVQAQRTKLMYKDAATN